VTDLPAILGSAGGACGAAAAVMSYVLSRRSVDEGKQRRATQSLVHDEIEPLLLHRAETDGQVTALAAQLSQLSSDIAKLHDRQGAVLDRITVLETKMEVFWKNVALDVARVLHSPNPERAHVDELLEAFMNGNLSPGERHDLKRLLVEIRDYHHGDPSAFPIFPGDQVAAAILLQTMDLVHGGKR
jgi:hypothetical protein